MRRYEEIFSRSVNQPDEFWAEAADAISWYKKWDRVLDDDSPPFYRWFVGGKLNTCDNAVDRHVAAGHGERIAIIHDSPVTGVVRKITYRELLDQVSLFAGVLQNEGVKKGDTVIIYMPMIPEAAVAMLACARLGAIHSVVFGGFAAHELALRIDHARPRVIVTASGAIEGKKILAYKPLVDSALAMAEHEPARCIVLQRSFITAELTHRDRDWAEAMLLAKPTDCVPVAATDPLYILYTSGTTGIPKGVIRDNGGHAVALHWSMENIYNVDAGDVFWSASDVGWVVGHSYIVYGPLLRGCTTVLYEGKPVGTPDPGAFWRVIAEHGVKVLFTAPTAFRAIKKEDPGGEYCRRYNLDTFAALYLAGERLDPDTYHWASRLLARPVIDHWWQTETGWAIVANCRGIEPLPVKPGSPTRPVPGFDVRIVDKDGQELGANQEGHVVIKLPLPPGTLASLWRDEKKFVTSYMTTFAGYYETSDGGYIDEDGYVYIMGRMDDVINVAGHRLSTGAMEEIIAGHPDVAECAVIGTHDDLKGELPMGFVVLKSGVQRDFAEVKKELAQLVRDRIGPIACYRESLLASRLPKTRSGKVLRSTMRAIANNREFRMPSTIDDPAILQEITELLAGRQVTV